MAIRHTGNGHGGLFNRADKLLKRFGGIDKLDEADIHDDPGWDTFGAIGKQLKLWLGGEEECLTVITCHKRHVWAVGVGMRKKNRCAAAKLALALRLGLMNFGAASEDDLRAWAEQKCEDCSDFGDLGCAVGKQVLEKGDVAAADDDEADLAEEEPEWGDLPDVEYVAASEDETQDHPPPLPSTWGTLKIFFADRGNWISSQLDLRCSRSSRGGLARSGNGILQGLTCASSGPIFWLALHAGQCAPRPQQ